MVIRQRAIQAEDKHERHHAILDAAERLLARAPDRLANMAEVADEAGLAKGTVYLYFPSKEELLLAVHERTIAGFFSALVTRLEQGPPLTLDAMMALTREHLMDPRFLTLAARCFGLLPHGVPPEAALAFKQRMAERIARAGEGLRRHYPQLAPGEGVALLRESYALIIGLWQMSAEGCPAAEGAPVAPQHVNVIVPLPYAVELERALRALWLGTLGASAEGGRP